MRGFTGLDPVVNTAGAVLAPGAGRAHPLSLALALLLPFRLVGLTLDAVFESSKPILFLPARWKERVPAATEPEFP